LHAKTNWLEKGWGFKNDPKYRPKISVIIPAFNESAMIKERLDNLVRQDYPKDHFEIIVSDDGSVDETVQIVEKWTNANSKKDGFRPRIVRNSTRQGKIHALQSALEQVDPDSVAVVFTDADAFWERESLGALVSYLADSSVGAVCGSIAYIGETIKLDEDVYRDYYNVLRVAESKVHSTPNHNGQLMAIRTEILRRIGLPNFRGSDDSAFGSMVAFAGYRAIQVDDAFVREPFRGSQVRRKIMRAQLLQLNFLKTKRYARATGILTKSAFDRIWRIELWLHLINPWLLVASIVLLGLAASLGSFWALVLLALGVVPLITRTYRMWILQQFYLLAAATRTLLTGKVKWPR
jgi:cellulose synthase/poly-beta-1,6-N-acetylglucosamine synthase-like glycosyltransferase